MAEMSTAKLTKEQLFIQIEGERTYLLRYATAKLRDSDAAEEAVQEALVAALAGINSFAGDSTLRTWLTSILKFKIIDFQRRVTVSRERFATAPAGGRDGDGETEGQADWLDQLFDESGHWRANFGTWAVPEAAHEQQAFFSAFERCMDKLPKATARVFFQREVMGAETEEICKDEEITPSNCWVILHRARLGLRECLESNWFGK
jgi:RNA polymerase sigma-70 factor, ECF subfamily